MPKLKTHKGAKSRFRVTGTGKIVRTKVGKSHLRRNKPGRVKRQYDAMLPVSGSDRTRVARLIPYGT
ncbi:MAG: 50S ribosomal protein L35 [Chloroflexota bacterium]